MALVCAVILWPVVSAAQIGATETRERGLEAFKAQKYSQAMRELEPIAREGNPEAAYAVGVMYEEGAGVLQNYSLAEEFLRSAAQNGHLEAKVRLAFHLAEKRKGADRAGEAADWFESAARQGHAVAQLNLALIYANGFSRPQDRRLAHMWANLAAANGSKKANELRSSIEKQMGADDILSVQSAARECYASNYARCGEVIR
jgi:hypothetical protein